MGVTLCFLYLVFLFCQAIKTATANKICTTAFSPLSVSFLWSLHCTLFALPVHTHKKQLTGAKCGVGYYCAHANANCPGDLWQATWQLNKLRLLAFFIFYFLPMYTLVICRRYQLETWWKSSTVVCEWNALERENAARLTEWLFNKSTRFSVILSIGTLMPGYDTKQQTDHLKGSLRSPILIWYVRRDGVWNRWMELGQNLRSNCCLSGVVIFYFK